jgi:6-phosphogluconolactonase
MKFARCLPWVIVSTILLLNSRERAMAQSNFWVYIGTNNRPPGKSEGIYLFRLDTDSGSFSPVGVAAKMLDPGWQAISKDGKFLYTNGTIDNHKKSIVAAFAIDPATGALKFINQQETNGNDTTHVDIDAARTCAVTANYNSGDMTVLPINSDGSLMPLTAIIKHSGSSVDPVRQTHPYPHSANFDPTGKWVLVPDLGVDKVYVYRYDQASHALMDGDPPTVAVTPGSGPRHLSFSPDGKFAYLIHEMGGILTVFAWDAGKGRLTTLQTISTLPKDYTGENTSAEVHILPNGRFLYASNRGPDDLAIFSRNPDGTVKLLGFESSGGKAPRDFNIDPSGNFLIAANQDSDSVTVFRVNQETGMLTRIGSPLEVPRPICVKFRAVQQ